MWPYDGLETLAIVRRIAAEVFGDRGFNEPIFLARGSNNAAYTVETGERKTVIRVTGDWRQRTTFQERWCYGQAARLGIPGPEVLAVGKVEKLPYIVLSFVDGLIGTEPAEGREGIWRTLGQYARLINSIDVGVGPVVSDGITVYPDPELQWLGWLDECDKALEDGRLIELGAYAAEQRPQIAAALAAMKQKQYGFGLSHGDLDPRNTIIGADGDIYLIDWCCSLVSLVPHVDLYNILREIDPAGPEIRAYLDGYDMSFDVYQTIFPEVQAYGLIQRLKRLGWSIDDRPDLVPGDIKSLRDWVDSPPAIAPFAA